MAGRVLPLIDLTSLADDDDPGRIVSLCENAVTPFGTVAAVCIWPRFVSQAVDLLSSTAVAVAAVANFPDGGPDAGRAVADARAIVDAGGTEVDLVFAWRDLIKGDAEPGRKLVAATRSAIGRDVLLKVILETGELVEADLIRTAAEVAIEAGADFLKTSTGKTPHSATPAAVRILLDVIADHNRSGGSPIGLKVSGGVRTVAQAGAYLRLVDEALGREWSDPENLRFGASALLDDVRLVLHGP